MADIDTLNIVIKSDTKEAIVNIDKLTTSLNNLKKSSNLSKTVNNLNKLNSVAKNIESNTTGAINRLGNSINKLKDTNLIKINNQLDKLSRPGKTNGALSKIKSLFGGLAIAKGIGYSIKSINEAIESTNLFSTTMGEFYNQASQWSSKVNDVLGIDNVEFEKAQGTFMAMAKGMGISAEQSYKLSKGFTEMAYDLSSFVNIPVQEAFTKLRSAMAGEIEPLRAVGVSVTQATLQEKAYAMGIQERVTTMTDAEKSLLRYQVILDSLRNMGAIGDFAKTLESPANALRVLKMQLVELARAIGSVFIPILTAVLPYLNAFVQVLTKAISSLAKLVGFKMPSWDNKSWNNAVGSVGGVADNLEGANKQAKELKRNLQGFDELNILEKPKDNASSGALGGGAGFDMDVEGVWDDALLDSVSSKTSQIVKDFEEKMERLKVILKEPFQDLDIQPMLDSLGRLKDALLPFGETIGQGLYWLYTEVFAPLSVWTIEDILPNFINAVASGIEYLNERLKIFGAWFVDNLDNIINATLIVGSLGTAFMILTSIPWELIKDGMKAIVDIFSGKTSLLDVIPMLSNLGGIATSIGIGLGPLIGIVIALGSAIYVAAKHFDEIKDAVGRFLEKIGFKDILEDITSAFGNVTNALGDCSELFELIGKAVLWVVGYALTPLIGVITGVFKAFSPLINVIGEVLKMFAGLGEFITGALMLDFDMMIGGLAKMCEGFAKGVMGLIESVGAFISGAFNGVVEWFKGLVNFLPNWAKNLLEGGQNLLNSIGSIFNFRRSIEMPVEVQAFANGGFIEDGLFTMNHGEIAGRFDNGQSVVANNEQIIEGIARGVANGISQGNSNKEININVDGRALASVIVDFINSETSRTGKSPITIY